MTANLEADEILGQAPEAVMLPTTATAILQKSSQTDSSAVEIADLLKSDQALSRDAVQFTREARCPAIPETTARATSLSITSVFITSNGEIPALTC